MKKVLSLVLAAVMIFSFAACGGSDGSSDPGSSAVADGAEETGGNEDGANAENNDNTEDPSQDQPLQVLIDDDNCTVTWSGYEVRDNGDNVFHFQFENKSADAEFRCYIDASNTARLEKEHNMLVNGYLIRSFNSYDSFPEVEPGESKEGYIIISAKDLKALGMTSVDKLDLPIIVSMDGADSIEETFSLYPTGVEEGAFTVPERPALESDRIVADYEDFKYIIVGVDENATYWDDDGTHLYGLDVYVQNDFDDLIEFSSRDYSINGETLDDLSVFSEFDLYDIPAKSKGLYTIAIEKSYLDYIGITEMNELTLTLLGSIYVNGSSWDTFVEGTITIDLTKLRKLN